MQLLVIIVGIIFAIVLHEMGHALAMHYKGIALEELGIGIPVSFIKPLRIKIGNLPRIALHPLLIGAYVKPTQEGAEKMASLPQKDNALISGAGVLVNIFFAAALIPINLAYTGDIFNPFFLDFWIKISAIIFGICALLWIFRRGFCQYIIPLLGSGMLVVLVGMVALHIFHLLSTSPPAENPALQVGGPIAIGKMASEVPKPFALLFVANISLSIGLFNMMPLMPLDGGRIMLDVTQKRFGERAARAFVKSTFTVLVALIALVFISDIARVVLPV